MRTLMFDCYRCAPAHPDEKCSQCLRWQDLPGQTLGPRTAMMGCAGSTDPDCGYVPIKNKGEQDD